MSTDLDTSAASFETATSSAVISVTSETDLKVTGKLYEQLLNLQKCYCSILEKYDVNRPQEQTSTARLLTRDQLNAGLKKTKFKKELIKDQLFDLIECTRPICLPNYQQITDFSHKPHTGEDVVQDHDITDLASRVEMLCSQNKSEFESLKSDLLSLKTSLSSFENFAGNNCSKSSPPSIPPELVEIRDTPYVIDHKIPFVDKYVENFVTPKQCQELLSTLSDLQYTKEKGRHTLKFGENYSYNGSRGNSNAEYPDGVKHILDTLNTTICDPSVPPLNSCLVTKYIGPESYIPPHCDDEKSIHPDSSICTITLGKDATVCFTDMFNGSKHEQLVKDCSLYTMSRKSQGIYKHAIDKNTSWGPNDVRISLTFRSVHWRNNNSTVIVGDSNTAGLKFATFGDGASTEFKGTFGNAMPGKRIEAFTVGDLDPSQCVGYNNIVVHCGINNVRKPEIKSEDDVREIYIDFKTKINDIIQVNKRSKIYVNTLLPTKLADCNRKVKYFNKLIVEDLVNSYNEIKVINSYYKFADSRGHLTQHLSRELSSDNQPDVLHLNKIGLRVLSVVIKNSIFAVKRERMEGVLEVEVERLEVEVSGSTVQQALQEL